MFAPVYSNFKVIFTKFRFSRTIIHYSKFTKSRVACNDEEDQVSSILLITMC